MAHFDTSMMHRNSVVRITQLTNYGLPGIMEDVQKNAEKTGVVARNFPFPGTVHSATRVELDGTVDYYISGWVIAAADVEVLAILETPRYQHDCNECKYLGRYLHFDLWYHVADTEFNQFGTCIARDSSDGPDYLSAITPNAVLFGSQHPLWICADLATKFGFARK